MESLHFVSESSSGGWWQFVTCWRREGGSPGCEALAGSECGLAAWGLHSSFPTRWHQHFFVTSELRALVQRGCAELSFPPKPVALGMGLGISNRLRCRGLFFSLISFQQEEKKLQCYDWDVMWSLMQAAVYIVSFLFFSGTTQERSNCKRGDSLMCAMVL